MKALAIIDRDKLEAYIDIVLKLIPKMDENISDDLHHEYLTVIVLKSLDFISDNFKFVHEQFGEADITNLLYRCPNASEALELIFEYERSKNEEED